MPLPLVSCIVPVFNGERYLVETLESILNQTYPRIEIIVVDDGSTDGTAQILKCRADKITRLYQKNRGPSAARNAGLRAAKGDLIAFLDADDLWLPDKIRLQAAFLAGRPELDVCFALVRNFWVPEFEAEKERLEKEGLIKLIHPYSVCSFLGRRNIFEKIGEFREDIVIGEDSDWFTRMKDAGIKNDVLSEKLVLRRLHANNLTRNMTLVSRKELARGAAGTVRPRESQARKAEKDPRADQGAKAGLFFKALGEAFSREEKHRPGSRDFYYSIAGHVVLLRFAGAALIPLLTPALEHLETAPVKNPSLTVCLCDDVPGKRAMPEIPWTENDLTLRRDIRGFDDDGHIRASFHEGSGTLHLLNSKENLAFFWARDVSLVLQPDRGAPLAKIFRWWMRRRGLQLVHAGVVGKENAGVLLAGKGGSGKSTTALTCLASGLDYVSDDYCLLTAEPPFTAYSLYNSAKLHTRELGRLPDLISKAGRGEPDAGSEKSLFFLNRSHSGQIAKRLSLRAIFVPVVHPQEESVLVRAAASIAMMALAPSSLFQISGWKSGDFYSLAKIAGTLPCYVFKIGNRPAGVARAVARFLEDSSA